MSFNKTVSWVPVTFKDLTNNRVDFIGLKFFQNLIWKITNQIILKLFWPCLQSRRYKIDPLKYKFTKIDFPLDARKRSIKNPFTINSQYFGRSFSIARSYTIKHSLEHLPIISFDKLIRPMLIIFVIYYLFYTDFFA